MKWNLLLLLSAMLAGGCGAFTDAQVHLVEQARRGLELENQAAKQRGEFVENYYQLQRLRLDAAFDADVRQTPELSKDWVIEHRRAYAAAVDAIHRQQSSAAQAQATSAKNRVVIDAALERLRALLSIYQRGSHVFDQSQR